MTFTHSQGTRGARQPGGRVMAWINRLNMRRIRSTGRVMGMDALVLTTIGRKTGEKRTTPVGWFPGDGGTWIIVASAAGAPSNPAWYLNLAAHPHDVEIDLGGETVPVDAEELHGQERDAAWKQITTAAPNFAKYEVKTDRLLPVIRLTRR